MSGVVLPFRRRRPIVRVVADDNPGWAIEVSYPDGETVRPTYIAQLSPTVRAAQALAESRGWEFQP